MFKKLVNTLIIVICTISLNQCVLFEREDCTNNLDPYFNNTITYKDHQIIEFINDSDGTHRFDTVHIKYPNVPKTYINDGTDQTHYKCEGQFTVTLGDYEIDGNQAGNFDHNGLQITTDICNNSYFAYKKIDTTNYLYNDTPVRSIHYYDFDSSWCSDCSRYGIEYYVSVADLRLLYYSVSENGGITNWRLK